MGEGYLRFATLLGSGRLVAGEERCQLTLDRRQGQPCGRACGTLLLALLSKETAALLPLMVFVLEWQVRRRAPGEALRRTAPLVVVALAPLAPE